MAKAGAGGASEAGHGGRSRALLAMGAVVAMVLGMAGGASAMTAACGVVLTNVASATFSINYDLSSGVGTNANGTAMVVIQNPQVNFWKTADTTTQAPGGVVTFCVSFWNVSACASAMALTITDKVPDNMRFGTAVLANEPPGGVIYGSWATALAGPWTDFVAGSPPSPPTGQGPVGGVYLRWAIPSAGINGSAAVCYSVTIL